MVLSEYNHKFLVELIQYYTKESSSYKEMAKSYVKEDAVRDTTFGIILGCLYSSFLQVYANQKLDVTNEDIKEFNNLIKSKTDFIMDSIRKK